MFYGDGRISSHSHQRRKDKDNLPAQLMTIIKLCESRCTIIDAEETTDNTNKENTTTRQKSE